MPTPRVSTRVRRTSHRQGPRAPEHLVERMVVAATGMVNAYTDRLMRALGPLLEARYGKPEPVPRRQDAATERPGAGGTVGGSSAALDDIFQQVQEGELSHGFLERMFHMVDRQAADDLGRVVPVSLGDVLPHAAQMKAAWIDKNTSLIRLEERAQKEVRAIITAPITEGVRVEEIRKQIEERMGVVRSRAELIARDQTLKLYGQVQEERQTEAGVVEYTWSTSQDERVRHRHSELEGTTQRWDSPPVVDKRTGRREHPGGDFQCRCSAIPVLPDDEAPISESRPSVRPANDVPPLSPEEQAFAEPLPIRPDPVELERKRLAEERAAAEAERELRAAAEERRRETERARAEVIRASRAAASPHAPKEIKFFGDVSHREQLEQRYIGRIEALAPTSKTPKLEALELHAVESFQIDVAGVTLEAAAYYDPRTTTLVMPTLAQTVLEHQMHPAIWGVTEAATSQADAALRAFTHEYGHHLHVTAALAGAIHFDDALAAAYERLAPKAAASLAKDTARLIGAVDAAEGAASVYGTQNPAEFWAEAFTAYHHERAWMKAHKRHLFDQVEILLQYLRDAAR